MGTVFHLDSSLLAAFLLCDTDMGLSSMGLLLLPLCLFVSARPQNRDLVMEDILEGGSQSEDSKVDVDQAFDLKIDAVEGAVNNSNLVQSMALSCPPPVATFLSLDDQPYMNDNEEYVRVARKQVGEVVGTLRLSAASPYFSSPQCSVQEDPEQLYSYFGVREEFNADTFSRGEECQVYLARSGLPVSMVNLTLLVVAEVTPGLPITCDVQVMVKVCYPSIFTYRVFFFLQLFLLIITANVKTSCSQLELLLQIKISIKKTPRLLSDFFLFWH